MKSQHMIMICAVLFCLALITYSMPFLLIKDETLNETLLTNTTKSENKNFKNETLYIVENAQLKQELHAIKAEIAARQYSNKRVGILTIHAGAGYNWANITIDNHKRYAKKHGYAYYIENGKGALDDDNKVDSRAAVWSKISALLRHMADDKHDWYWALDMDTLFMNSTIKAEDILDDNYDLVVDDDCNMFNGIHIF
jgi:hypothetical protein